MSRHLTRAAPQIAALALVLLANWILFPPFFDLSFQNGRLYGPLEDGRCFHQTAGEPAGVGGLVPESA